MRRFELEGYVRGIERWGITELYMVPPIAVAVIMSPLVQSGEVSLRSVKAGAVGAAPLTKETQARLRGYLGEGTRFCQVWGMTVSTPGNLSWDNLSQVKSIRVL